MRFLCTCLLSTALFLAACGRTQGTEPPPDGWANNAPTQVTQVVELPSHQLLSVQQGELQAWVQVPKVGADVGDYVLLGAGTPRSDVEVAELGRRVEMVVDIEHVQVVDEATARSTLAGTPPSDAVPVGTLYAELVDRAGSEVVVYGSAVKVTSAVGSVWIHIQDGTGDAASGTNDITVEAKQAVTVGQRVAFRGVLHADVDLGFGYHFDALIRDAELVP